MDGYFFQSYLWVNYTHISDYCKTVRTDEEDGGCHFGLGIGISNEQHSGG